MSPRKTSRKDRHCHKRSSSTSSSSDCPTSSSSISCTKCDKWTTDSSSCGCECGGGGCQNCGPCDNGCRDCDDSVRHGICSVSDSSDSTESNIFCSSSSSSSSCSSSSDSDSSSSCSSTSDSEDPYHLYHHKEKNHDHHDRHRKKVRKLFTITFAPDAKDSNVTAIYVNGKCRPTIVLHHDVDYYFKVIQEADRFGNYRYDFCLTKSAHDHFGPMEPLPHSFMPLSKGVASFRVHKDTPLIFHYASSKGKALGHYVAVQ